jgi:hypothetical protein
MKKKRTLIISDRPAAAVRGDHYLDRLGAMERAGRFPAGGLTYVQIRHDDWCALLRHGGACNCSPDIETVPIPRGGR